MPDIGPPEILGPFAPALLAGLALGVWWGWRSGTRRGHGRIGRTVAGGLLGLLAAALLVNGFLILRRLF